MLSPFGLQKNDISEWTSQLYLIHLDNLVEFIQNTDFFFIIYKATHIL